MATKRQRHQPDGKKPILLAAALLLFCGGCFVVPKVFNSVIDRRMPQAKEYAAPGGKESAGETLRGNIFDRHGIPVAVSLPFFSVYVKPLELRVDREQMEFLAAALKVDPDSLEKQFQSEHSVVWLARYIRPQIAKEIKQQEIRGLYLVSEPQRYYPAGESCSHVVGCSRDGHGLAGVEFSLDQVLQGSEQGRGLTETVLPPIATGRKNKHIILQLDTTLQRLVERKLANLKKKTGATAVWGVVLEPANGAVLAMASLPDYDPNRFWEFSEQEQANRTLESSTAIGSLEGLFRLAEALDNGKSPAETKAVESEEGDGWHKGMAGDFVSDSLWRLLGLLPAFPAEEASRFFPADPEAPFAAETVSPVNAEKEGLRNKVSTMQLARGFAALVNGGRLPVLRLVRAVCDDEKCDGEEQTPAQIKVLKPETSGMVRALLTSGKSRAVLFTSLEERTKEQLPDSAMTDAGRGNRFDAVMLGYLNGEKADSVLAVVLQDGGDAADFRTKGWESVGREIMKKSVAVLTAGKSLPTASNLKVNMEAAYRGWRGYQEKVAGEAPKKAPAKVEVMPSVTGLSLRKALHLLQPLELSCSIKGSGVVIGQQPHAGQTLKNGRVCLLLQPDTGSIRSM